jgi:anthranilate synthase component 1
MTLVARSLVQDDLTPVRAYAALRAASSAPTFLLESAVNGERWGRYSILGYRPRVVIELPEEGDPLAAIGLARTVTPVPSDVASKFARARVGIFPYDLVHALAPVPRWPSGQTRGRVMGDATVVVFDHLAHTLQIAAHDPSALDETEAILANAVALRRISLPDPAAQPLDLSLSMDDATFGERVLRAKEYIAAGDAFQVVLARTFSAPMSARDPLDVYRALRVLSASPYMFLVDFPATEDAPSLTVAGASPETLVRLEDGTATLRPIAGTRRRGRTPEEDEALARELLADPKERAEHVMLIDLARNDTGRIAEVGSVALTKRMEIERFSHVMHIVSEVTGKVRAELSPLDVLAAAFPAGTLTGAPKVRAMQIIRELEARPRGVYGGAIGYATPSGELDLAIAIRTVVMSRDRCEVTAGAGIVEASDPKLEALETRNKARAAIAAIAAASR